MKLKPALTNQPEPRFHDRATGFQIVLAISAFQLLLPPDGKAAGLPCGESAGR
jgi:hypothetical protein